MGQEENLRKGCHTRAVRSLRKSNQRDMSEKNGKSWTDLQARESRRRYGVLFDCPERVRSVGATAPEVQLRRWLTF